MPRHRNGSKAESFPDNFSQLWDERSRNINSFRLLHGMDNTVRNKLFDKQ